MVPRPGLCGIHGVGGMAERLKAHAWKACVRESVPWVRIPLPPPRPEPHIGRGLAQATIHPLPAESLVTAAFYAEIVARSLDEIASPTSTGCRSSRKGARAGTRSSRSARYPCDAWLLGTGTQIFPASSNKKDGAEAPPLFGANDRLLTTRPRSLRDKLFAPFQSPVKPQLRALSRLGPVEPLGAQTCRRPQQDASPFGQGGQRISVIPRDGCLVHQCLESRAYSMAGYDVRL